MKALLAIATLFLFSFTTHWQNDFAKAKEIAATEHKLILLNFSGSDWCGPCIRMHKEIFENATFTAFADKQLVLVNADFPRDKKNQLPKPQQQQNEKLADAYNASGNFPSTVLLTADGKVLRTWEGVPNQGVDAFINDIKASINAGN